MFANRRFLAVGFAVVASFSQVAFGEAIQEQLQQIKGELKALEDSEEAIVFPAIKGISKLQATEAIPLLIKVLQRSRENGNEMTPPQVYAAIAANALTGQKFEFIPRLPLCGTGLKGIELSAEAGKLAGKEREELMKKAEQAFREENDRAMVRIAEENRINVIERDRLLDWWQLQQNQQAAELEQKKIAETKRKIAEENEARRKSGSLMIGRDITIVAVNQSWNFVVLNIGDKKGAVMNAKLSIQRNGTRIGAIKISSLEPDSSVADIISKSVAREMRVQPGDKAVLER